MSTLTAPDVALETAILMAYHSYISAPRHSQGALWRKLALLTAQRDKRQDELAAVRRKA